MTKRAIVASYYPPEIDRDTGSRRVAHVIAALADSGWSVTFFAVNGIRDRRYADDLRQRGVAVYDGTTTPLDEIPGIATHQLSVMTYWPVAERLLPIVRRHAPAAHAIVDSIDLHLLRDSRRILQPPPGRDRGGLLSAEDGAQFAGELNVYAAADAVLTVSEKEARLVDDLTGQAGLARAVPLLEDTPPSPLAFGERRGILMVGNYQHAPNVQAVEWLCREIAPQLAADLLAEHPIQVVGAGLDDTVRRYGEGLAHVRMIGWVPSIAPYLQRSRITVIPLKYGAGIKGKLLEALSSGTPAVTTTVGAEGLAVVDGKEVIVADTPEAFAAAVSRLLTDERLWKRVAHRGREYAARMHGRAAVTAQLAAIVDDVSARRPKAPTLPELTAEQYQARVNYQYYQQLMPRIRDVVERATPADSTVLIVSGGAGDLLRLDGRAAQHFPGEHSDDAGAIAALEASRSAGAEFLVVPAPTVRWLDDRRQFKAYLEERFPVLSQRRDVCMIYGLNGRSAHAHDSAGRNGHGNGNGHLNGAGIETVPQPRIARRRQANDADSTVRAIAFYLPQYHPIPENSAAWGEGFTEWRNVAKATAQFSGHQQPHVPGELGFYDLRLAETRAAQADLAREHGIFGFCYYHYWFHGKRLLERPFAEVLASGQPDFPFCLCWANEPWSRRWDGSAEDVIQPQAYSAADDEAHIAALLPALRDRRAITVDGKPMFLVYQGRELPDPRRTIDIWRRAVRRAGLAGLFLVAVETGWDAGWDATAVGFDAKVLFQPQFSMLRQVPAIPIPGKDGLSVYDYNAAWPVLANPEPVAYPRFDTVFPSWDNSPRTGERSVVVHNSSPAAYEEWLRHAISRAQQRSGDHQLVFINAWNEWAEGCHLEPDGQNGRAYLEATRRALADAHRRRAVGVRRRTARALTTVDHAWNRAAHES